MTHISPATASENAFERQVGFPLPAGPPSWNEQAYPNLIYSNEFGHGGDFAARDEPLPFFEELRAALGRFAR